MDEDADIGVGDVAGVTLTPSVAFTLGFLGAGGGGDMSPTGGGLGTVRRTHTGRISRTTPRPGLGEEGTMRICVPSAGPGGLDDFVGEHFGRVPTYTIYDTETGEVEIFPNESEHMGGVGLPAEHLAQAGVDLVICSGLGRRAIDLFSQNGIEVVTGATGTVREAIEAWQSGRLSGAEACGRHMFHDR